ncbi:LRR receptor-like serine/threonine-protein kinase GSO2 [Papaver somniferum]|uniref:LRR receptor-like serine/threonine-protein kinase GSO2 n=1 Tax=Papaver somniferum TaxID=3469 RepID=UPI000E6FAD2C|nr:LRR receptor-like serine/threonine-protein kinase GSO2 [Papaver somniferum]
MAGIELNSSFPSQMANLTSLSIFELSHSNIRGSVPYLPQLEELDVSDNHDLHVDLPRMFKQQWPKLQKLWISSTVLNRPIPSSISNAPLLVSLSASSCSIQGSLPSSIYNLSQLQYLDLSGNSITGFIHPSFSNLESLYYLDLSSNNFQGSIPKSMCENLSFQILRLDYNNITGTVPSCITKLQNLKVFSAARNSIEGNVSLFSLSENLTTLDMRFNSQLNLDMRFNLDQYSSLYPKLNLKYLWLGSCNFKGLFPISFCNLTNLVELDVSQNRLTGTIPSCLSQLRYLRRIYVTENKLHGPVPLPPPGIEVFDLSNNKLSGEISIEVGKRLFNASAISLAGNELSGSIPFTLCPTVPSFTSTQFIDLSGNKLSGTIPSNIGYCRNLGTLKLGNNNLTGKVPDELKLAKNIRFLQLNNNHLDGNPTNLASEFRKLEFLNLANNNFEGSIPKTLGSLKHLRFLSLRSNNFNGSIPKEIIHLQDLQLIDLAINKFSGNLPNKCGNLRGLIMTKYLVDLNYGDVQLDVATKGIMIQIKKLNNYSSTIDLSCNNLDGNIPKEIGLLTLLSSLNLSNNYFSGDIPESIADLSGLESLDLNSNKLSGHIPQSLTNIDSLAVLDLSFNKLSGMIPRGPHFDTLSLDGSAFTGNELLCGFPTEKICKGDRNTGTSYVSPVIEVDGVDRDDAMEKFLLYAIVVLGFVVGFWGLFFVLLLRKEKWWFPYWRSIDFIAVRITNFIQNQNERL